MNAELASPEAIEKTVTPTLRLTARVRYARLSEVPVSVSGVLMAGGIQVAMLTEVPGNNRYEIPLGVGDQMARDDYWVDFLMQAPLTRQEVAHLERVHESSPRGDMLLSAKLVIRYIKAKLGQIAVKESGNGPGPASPLVVGTDNYQAFRLVHLASNSKDLFEIQSETRDVSATIPGSTWTHDFAPRLGIGRFVVFELPRPVDLKGTGPLTAEIDAAVEAVLKAEGEIVAGDWTDVCEDLRGVVEILKNRKVEIEALLLKDGYTAEAATNLTSAMSSLFDLTSKFHHKLDRGKKIAPEIKAAREDAYLLFSNTLSALNLIATKARKYS